MAGFQPQNREAPRILVIQTAFLGDVILGTAVLENLKAEFPNADIRYLIRKGNEGVLEGHPFLNQLLIWDKKKGKFADLFRLIREVRAWKPDAVINLHRFFNSGLVTLFSGAPYTAGFRKNPLSLFFSRKAPHRIGKKGDPSYLHETERNHGLLKDLTTRAVCLPRVYPTQGARDLVKPFQKQPYICIAPASVWFTKQWPAARWRELVDRLPNTFRVYVLGGPGDFDLCESIAAADNRNRTVNLAGKLSLSESAALMEGAAHNFVNDSGPLHLASATGAPVTAIFCSTIPEFGFCPVGPGGNLVQIAEPLSCRPCGLHGQKKCPEGHFHCAMKISSEHVFSAFQSG